MLRPISQTLTRIARDVYYGDEQRCDEAPPAAGCRLRSGCGWARLHTDERGKITLISSITLLFFLLLICYVGNVGVAVKDKMELQNAADSAAYSSALWKARGMNAVTVTNHMLGEATAMVVLIDSFGGKLLEKGEEYYSSESDAYDQASDLLREAAVPKGIVSKMMASVDRQLIDYVADKLSEDNGYHQSGAAIFDSQLNLKFALRTTLTIKSVASTVSLISNVPLFAWVDGFCIVVHVAGSYVLVKIGQEWAFLEALESIVGPLRKFKQGLERYAIPAISAYGDTVARKSASGTLIQRSVDKSLLELQSQMPGRPITLEVVSEDKQLSLPLVAEPAPAASQAQAKSGTWEIPESAWKNGRFDEKDKVYEGMVAAYLELTRPLRNFLDAAEWVRYWYPDFSDLLGTARNMLNKIAAPERPNPQLGFESNPSLAADSDYRLPSFDWQTERTSQWTRGTYPYVNSFRSGILDLMTDGVGPFNLRISDAASYYAHWTNRYTLVKSYEIRSGELHAFGDAPHMYVMEGMEPNRKGYESWTRDRDEAAGMFAVYAFAYRRHESTIFGPGLFTDPNERGQLAMSAAMFYNANGRDVPGTSSTGTSAIQPNTGWDTLNWRPPVKAREWGGEKPDKRGDNVSSLIRGGLPAPRNAEVQTNWQAKLIPLTLEDRAPIALRRAGGAGGSVSEPTRELVREALRDVELLKH